MAPGGTNDEEDEDRGDTCAICRGGIENRSTTEVCEDSFCFSCLKEWSATRSRCPVCEEEFDLILHGFRGGNSYSVFWPKLGDHRIRTGRLRADLNDLISRNKVVIATARLFLRDYDRLLLRSILLRRNLYSRFADDRMSAGDFYHVNAKLNLLSDDVKVQVEILDDYARNISDQWISTYELISSDLGNLIRLLGDLCYEDSSLEPGQVESRKSSLLSSLDEMSALVNHYTDVFNGTLPHITNSFSIQKTLHATCSINMTELESIVYSPRNHAPFGEVQ